MVSPPAAAVTLGPELPGCAGRWWPLAAGQTWRWRIERTSVGDDGRTHGSAGIRDTVVRTTSAQRGLPRFVLDGWPAPWSDELAVPVTIEVDGPRLAVITEGLDHADGETIEPWIDLGRAPPPGDPERDVTAGGRDRPATLVFTWRSMSDDLELTLACGVGPIGFEYHHHGTLEELHAVRLQ